MRDPDGGNPEMHVSSVVVRVREGDREDVICRIEELAGAEVVHAEGSRVIVVMETPDSSSAGQHLAAISSFDGVLSAGLAFEHAETAESLGEIV